MKPKTDDATSAEQSPKKSINALLIATWYSSSIISSKLNYVQLKYLGSAVKLSLYQQSFVSIAGIIVLLTTRPSTPKSTSSIVKSKPGMPFRSISLLAIAMTFMSISYNSAMLYIPVSFLNTIKATIPLWTSIVCWYVHKKRFSFLTQISLLAVVGGVGLASASELGFHPIGFMLGIFSAWNQTFFNLRAKSVLVQDAVSPLQLQVFTACLSATALGTICLLSKAFLRDQISDSATDLVATPWPSPFILLALGGLNYFAELRLSYAAIGALGSLGYSIADVFRRLILICSAVVLFGNPIQLTNIVGVFIAMIGILLYNLSDATKSTAAKTVPDWASKKKLELPVNSSCSTPTVLFAV